MLRRLIVAAFLSSSSALVGAIPWASAAGPCPPGQLPGPSEEVGVICVPASNPGTEGTTAPTGTTGGGTGEATECVKDGEVVPCVTSFGTWFPSQGCYAQQVVPPPVADDPIWGGTAPEDGTIWACSNQGFGTYTRFLVPNGETPALVDPGVLAQQALGQMKLATPAISMAPAPPLRTYVGLETWLWMPPEQFSPLSLTVTAGPTAVTVVAKPVRSTWDMGAGSTTCNSAGRAWVKGYDDSQTTDCSYTYDRVSTGQLSDAFPVTATLAYQVDWTCAGGCLASGDTLGEVNGASGAAAIEVGERQSVVVQ